MSLSGTLIFTKERNSIKLKSRKEGVKYISRFIAIDFVW